MSGHGSRRARPSARTCARAPLGALILLTFGLLLGLSSEALAQISFTESGAGGCFANPTSSHTDCAIATFSLMTGGTNGQAGNVISGSSASDVTGLQIVIQNTTPTSLTSYLNADLLTGFFWGINGNPTFATTTTPTGKRNQSVTSVNGSAIATNSTNTPSGNANAIVDPAQCATVAVCTGKSINVGAYWASSYKVGGWTGVGGTFAGSYALSVSGYTNIALGQGHPVGAGDPSLVSNGNSSLNFGMIGGAGSTPSVGNLPAIQDTVTIQLAFASALSSLNLDKDIIAKDVYFAYGTNPDASTVAVVENAPEPASMALLGVGALGITLVRRRKRIDAVK